MAHARTHCNFHLNIMKKFTPAAQQRAVTFSALFPKTAADRPQQQNSRVSSVRFVRAENPIANPSNPLTITRTVGVDEGKCERCVLGGSAGGV